MIIGAHVSTAGGLTKALENGERIGAQAIQIFPSAPVQWRIRGWSDDDCRDFKNRWPAKFSEVVFHAIYLINLASFDSDNLRKSVTALIETLRLAEKLGIEKVIFHPGSYIDGAIGQKQQISSALKEIYAETPSSTKLIFENSSGTTIGGRLEDLSWLLDQSPSDRAGICLDTCHAFAAGYQIDTDDGYVKFKEEIKKIFGLDRVLAWHLNDSKFGRGELRDRHENIGEGKIGSQAFSRLVNDPDWKSVVGYLEVPGFDDKGPDRQNVERLKNLKTDRS